MKILVLNGGSSTLKATLRELGEGPLPVVPPPLLWDAYAEWGRQSCKAHMRVRSGAAYHETGIDIETPRDVLRPVIESLWSGPAKAVEGPHQIAVAGHRVVHGGRLFQKSTLITPEVKKGIDQCANLAPEHNPFQLQAIEATERALGPGVPQVVVFDTAFHSTLPPCARVYGVPYEWYEDGVERYGFHGISHQYASRRAAGILGRDPAGLRLVTCHLGNGASLAAVSGGQSIDTTMGFTPLEGLMMGTRSGSIDPAIPIYLMRSRGYGADRLDRALNKESGLKGVSGLSGDMREILAAIDSGNQRAKLAFDVYTHRLLREIGGMAASLGGLDVLVFTAGIGENCPPLREAVCRRLAFLGVRLDPEKNAGPPMDSDIAAPDSAARVLVVHAEEDWEIACECRRMLAEPRASEAAK
jgi:acetate kinase